MDNVKGVRAKAEKGKVLFGTIDTYLLYRLTAGKSHKTDHTNASRTLIFNIEKKEWDKELLKILQIPEAILPETHNSSSLFGRTEGVKGLPDGIPISSLVGDQQGALFGQLCTEPGEAKNTYGTGCFLLFNTGNKLQISKNNLITTLACGPEGKTVYCLEGSIFIGGAVIQYLRDNLRFFKESKLSEKMAASVTKDDEVVFVPAFSGLGAPYWDMNARGAILGLTRDTTQEQITRAALKSIALQSYELVEAMENDTGSKLKVLKVDGGATANNWLMQYQADILGKKIVRPSNLDTTVLGAAYLAGLERGFYSSVNDLKKNQKTSKEFSPKLSSSLREKEIRVWKNSVKRILTSES